MTKDEGVAAVKADAKRQIEGMFGMTDDQERDRGLGEKSYIQIGFALVLISFAVGAIWWAATMQSKMDQVIEEVKTSRVTQSKVIDGETKLQILDLRMKQLEVQVLEATKAAQAAAQAAQAAALAATQAMRKP